MPVIPHSPLKRVFPLGLLLLTLSASSALGAAPKISAPSKAPTPTQAAKPTESAEEAKLNDIRRVLILTGSDKLALQVMQQMIVQFKEALPQVPDAFWTEFMTEVNPSEIVELAVPIYAKHLTHDDIKELLRFYESPVGAKYVSVLPQITQESMLAGQTWGGMLGERVLNKLKEKGYTP